MSKEQKVRLLHRKGLVRSWKQIKNNRYLSITAWSWNVSNLGKLVRNKENHKWVHLSTPLAEELIERHLCITNCTQRKGLSWIKKKETKILNEVVQIKSKNKNHRSFQVKILMQKGSPLFTQTFFFYIYNLHFFEQNIYSHQVLIYLNVPGIPVRKPLQNRQIDSWRTTGCVSLGVICASLLTGRH